MGIARSASVLRLDCGQQCRAVGREGEIAIASHAIELGEAATRPNGVNVPLGQDRAQPSLQRTSPVEVTEKGAAIGDFADAVEFSKQGVCQFTSRRRLWRTTQKKGC